MNQICSRVIVSLAVLFFCVHGKTEAGDLKLIESEVEMRQQLLRQIPIGTNTEDGKSILENNGFLCSWQISQRLAGYKDKMNFVYCSYQSHDFLIAKKWQIALLYEGSKVKDIAVYFGLVGL